MDIVKTIIGTVVFILILVLLMTLFGCSGKKINYDDYSLEDYPDIPTIGHQSIEKYKKSPESS